MIQFKIDPKGRKRKYITGSCCYCGSTHTVLYQGFKKYNRIAHRGCFIKYNSHGQHLKGKKRRTKDKMMDTVIYGYNKSALRRNLEWNITKDEFHSLSQANCVYCGIEPMQHHAHDLGLPVFLFNGIDRVDNDRGYVSDNVVTCCYQCNLSKRNLSLTEWVNYLNRIVQYRMRKTWCRHCNIDHVHGEEK